MVTPFYEIALVVAKNKKRHTMEELIMHATKVLVKHVIGDEAASKLNIVSFSNNTIQRHFTEISTDINELVFTEVQSSKCGFAVQLDETRREDVFELVDNIFKANDLRWSKLVGCTLDRKSGFQARVKAVSICHFRSLLHKLIRSRC